MKSWFYPLGNKKKHFAQNDLGELSVSVNKDAPFRVSGADISMYPNVFTEPKNITESNNSTGMTYRSFPSITKAPDGTLVCVYYEGTAHVSTGQTNIAMRTSSDGGKTWSAPYIIYTSPSGQEVRDPSIVYASDQGVWLISAFLYNNTVNHADSIIVLKSSSVTVPTTAGQWSMATVNQPFNDINAVSHAPIVMVNGGLYLLVYGRNTGETENTIALLDSSGSGSTWNTTSPKVIVKGVGYTEASLTWIPENTGNTLNMICVVRIENSVSKVYLSRDVGATWTFRNDLSVEAHAPQFIWGDNGKLYLAYRLGGKFHGSWLAVSEDNGMTFKPLGIITEKFVGYADLVKIGLNSFGIVYAEEFSTKGNIYFRRYFY